jgi:hypothetical protein
MTTRRGSSVNRFESFTDFQLDRFIEGFRGIQENEIPLLNEIMRECDRRKALNKTRRITVKRSDTIAHCGAETTATETWDNAPDSIAYQFDTKP